MRAVGTGGSGAGVINVYSLVKHVEGFSQAPPRAEAALYRSRVAAPTGSGSGATAEDWKSRYSLNR